MVGGVGLGKGRVGGLVYSNIYTSKLNNNQAFPFPFETESGNPRIFF